MKLRLIRPSTRYKSSYVSGLREFIRESEHPEHLQDQIEHFSRYLNRWRLLSKGQISSVVPQTIYWLVDGTKYLGLVQSLTHNGLKNEVC